MELCLIMYWESNTAHKKKKILKVRWSDGTHMVANCNYKEQQQNISSFNFY